MPPNDHETPYPNKPDSDTDEAEQSASSPGAGPGSLFEDEEDDGGIPDAVRQRVEAWVPELVKRAFAAGMGAVFTTEDGIRKITKDMPLPKDVAGYLVNTAGNTKDEFFKIVSREVREFLTTINLSDEIAKMLTTLSFEVKTEIRFIPNDEKYGGVEPDVKAKVRVKRSDARFRRKRVFRRKPSDDSSSDS